MEVIKQMLLHLFHLKVGKDRLLIDLVLRMLYWNLFDHLLLSSCSNELLDYFCFFIRSLVFDSKKYYWVFKLLTDFEGFMKFVFVLLIIFLLN